VNTYDSTKRIASPPFEFRSNDFKMKKPMSAKTIVNQRFIATASTRNSMNSDNVMRLQKTGWSERIGLPISTYNENVYPRYKILFDHL